LVAGGGCSPGAGSTDGAFGFGPGVGNVDRFGEQADVMASALKQSNTTLRFIGFTSCDMT
jgi:hypothetical protein